jgi:hypothetical protein
MKSSSRQISIVSVVVSGTGIILLSVLVAMAILQYIPNINAVAQKQVADYSHSALRAEKLAKVEQNGITSMPKYSPNSVSQTLNYSHYVPLSPISNSPGNQVKLLLDYKVQESSLIDHPINAIMEVYAANHSLIRTSSLPKPLNLTNSVGTIQLATTLNDSNLKNVTAVALITDDEKVIPVSNTLESRLNLGEMRTNER